MAGRLRPRLMLWILCLTVFAVSAFMLISYYAQGDKEQSAFQELAAVAAAEEPAGAPQAAADVLSGYQKLHGRNPDMVGWVKIDGTSVNYPVMYTPDDGEFYLSHGFDKEKSKSGTPFIDRRCSVNPLGTNTIIYGHHMKNGTMFAGLTKYKEENYYKEHPTVRFDTLYEQQEYGIIAVFESRIYALDEKVFKHYNFINVNNRADFDEYIKNIKKLSLYDTGVTASYGNELLTLVTCDYQTENGQMVVVAKKKNE